MCSDKNFVKLVGTVLISCCLALSFLSNLYAGDQSKFLFKPVPVTKGGVLSPGEEEQLAKLKELKTTKDLWVAELNLNLFQSKSVTLNMSEDKPLGAVTDSIEKRSDDDFTWFGKIPELSDTGSAVLVVKDGQMTGNVFAGNDVYQVVPLGSGRHAIIHVDQSKFPPDEGDDHQKVEKSQKELRKKYGDKHSKKDASDSFDQNLMAEDGEIPVIKVMVAYTPPARQKAGGKPQIEAQIQSAVDLSNKSYANSDVRLKLRIVHQFELNFQESGDIFKDKDTFVKMGNTSGDEVSRLRDQYRGDVGALIISQCQKTGGTCGLAADIGAKPQTAFCVVLLECMTNNLSFPHEIGHLLGARHNWEADPTGRTQHGSWFKGKDKKNHWRTIMSYPCPGGSCTRKPYWSNPKTKIDGMPTGSPACCSNAAVLNANASRMSKFR